MSQETSLLYVHRCAQSAKACKLKYSNLMLVKIPLVCCWILTGEFLPSLLLGLWFRNRISFQNKVRFCFGVGCFWRFFFWSQKIYEVSFVTCWSVWRIQGLVILAFPISASVIKSNIVLRLLIKVNQTKERRKKFFWRFFDFSFLLTSWIMFGKLSDQQIVAVLRSNSMKRIPFFA